MNKGKLQLLSPLFLKYQAEFEKNSRSRVFAPLAESYRKVGMTDKAMEILSQGIRFHPSYTMGYLGLAFCYFDIRQYNLAYTTLRPLVESNRDNIRLQKLFADVCIEIGKKEEALETLKYLLFVNPRDRIIADLVLNLESEIESAYKPTHKPIFIPEANFNNQSEIFNVEQLSKPNANSNDFDDWLTVDLKQDDKNKTHRNAEKSDLESDQYNNWNVKKGSVLFNDILKEQKKEESKTFHVHLDLESGQATEKNSTQIEFNTPLVTHTLVDLYCGQGHIEKALEVLEKILLLNPNDQKTIRKIKEIQELAQPLSHYDIIEEKTEDDIENISDELEDSEQDDKPDERIKLVYSNELVEGTEEEGRRNLMSLIDEKIGPIEIDESEIKREIQKQISEKLTLFLKKIQKRALDYQSSV